MDDVNKLYALCVNPELPSFHRETSKNAQTLKDKSLDDINWGIRLLHKF
jgi:hypothetical protein